MTHIKNGIIFIQEEPEDKCEYCGNMDELRPYGKNKARICFDCANKPENKSETDKNLHAFIDQAKPINPGNN